MPRACLSLALVLTLATQVAVADTAQTPPPDSCGRTALDKLIGQPFGGIDPMAVKGPIRIQSPRESAPTDSNPLRTIVQVDKSGVIVRLSCG